MTALHLSISEAHRPVAGLFQLALDHGIGKSCDGIGTYFPDDFRRRPGRHEQAVPRRHLVTRNARLGGARRSVRIFLGADYANRHSSLMGTWEPRTRVCARAWPAQRLATMKKPRHEKWAIAEPQVVAKTRYRCRGGNGLAGATRLGLGRRYQRANDNPTGTILNLPQLTWTRYLPDRGLCHVGIQFAGAECVL
jgi:hypothetical protein